jgi:hypothetical protein
MFSEERVTSSSYVCDHHPLQMPMRIRKPKMPATGMRRATSRGGDSTVHLLNFAVADSTYANKDSRDSTQRRWQLELKGPCIATQSKALLVLRLGPSRNWTCTGFVLLTMFDILYQLSAYRMIFADPQICTVLLVRLHNFQVIEGWNLKDL